MPTRKPIALVLGFAQIKAVLQHRTHGVVLEGFFAPIAGGAVAFFIQTNRHIMIGDIADGVHLIRQDDPILVFQVRDGIAFGHVCPAFHVILDQTGVPDVRFLVDLTLLEAITEGQQLALQEPQRRITECQCPVPEPGTRTGGFAFGGFAGAVLVIPLGQQRKQMQHELALRGRGIHPGFRHRDKPDTRFL